MNKLILWSEWTQAFSALRVAFSRQTTFFWAIVACAGMTIRDDHFGVTSIVRAFGLTDASYHCLLRLFHSNAVNLDKLLSAWIALCFNLFDPICVDGFMVLIVDGVKIGKEGKKMPAVKSLHQDSASNSKSEFIMGHYFEAVSLAVVSPLGKIAAIPLVARIHDGIVKSNRGKKTLIDKAAELLIEVTDRAGHPAIVIADAYYAAKTMINPLIATGNHLVTRVQHNASAHYSAVVSPRRKRPGRPKKYGEKVVLRELFKQFDTISERGEDYRYYCIDLIWRPVKQLVRFVLVEHETKGRYILMTTNLSLSPQAVVKLYRSRWLIETGFKQSIHTIGTYAYHFWMKGMTKIKKCSNGQHLHRCSEVYRSQVDRKLKAFNFHVALGCIAHGLTLHLAINFRVQVWKSFSGWLRTLNKSQEPSELVVAKALQATLPNFLQASKNGLDWRKFLLSRINLERQGPMSRVA